MSNAERDQKKKQLLEKMLEEDYAFVHLRVRCPGVLLPLNLMQESVVTLKVSHNFRGAMTISEEKFIAELSFGNKVFACHVPWDAVWGLTSFKGERLMWLDEVPPDMLSPDGEAKSASEAKEPPPEAPKKQKDASKEAKRPALKRIK